MSDDAMRCPNPDCGRIWPDDWERYTWYPCRCGMAASISGVASVRPNNEESKMSCERGESPVWSTSEKGEGVRDER